MLLGILSILMFLCVSVFCLGGIIFLAGAGSDSDFVALSGLSSIIGMLGMFVLTIPYLIITGY